MGFSRSVLDLRRLHWPLEPLQGVKETPPSHTELGSSQEGGRRTKCRPGCHQRASQGCPTLSGGLGIHARQGLPGIHHRKQLGDLAIRVQAGRAVWPGEGPALASSLCAQGEMSWKGAGGVQARGSSLPRPEPRAPVATPEPSGHSRGKQNREARGKRKSFLTTRVREDSP